MANTKSAKKRALQSDARHARKSSIISALKSGQKKLAATIASGNAEEAKAQFTNVIAALDKAAKRGVIHKNSADRKKGTLNKALKATAKA